MTLKNKNKKELIEEIEILQKRIAEFDMPEHQRMLASQEPRESEGWLRDITFSFADWIWEVDKNGVYTYSSSKGTELLGRVIGKTPFDFMPPDEAKRVAGIFSEIAANKKPIKDLENWNVQSDGERICLLTNGLPIIDEKGNLRGYRGVDKDITESKRLENVLRESEAKYRLLFERSNDAVFLVDISTGRYLDANAAAEKLTGRSSDELKSLTTSDICPKESTARLTNIKNLKETIEFNEVEYVRNDGTIRFALLTSFPLTETIVFGIAHDITKRKRANEELLAEKNKLQSIMSAMNSGVTIRNLDYELIYQNDYSLNIFGNHLGEKCYRVFAGIERVCDDCPVEKAVKDGKSHSHTKEVEAFPGEITFWENTAIPMKDGNGSIYACLEINDNITESKKAEAALRESESALRNSQTDLRKLAGRLISAQEEELRRLSRELHDDLTQRLAVLAIEAGKLEIELGKKTETFQEASQMLSWIKDELISVSEDVHNISRQLHPAILDDLGLVRAIESRCSRLMKQEDIEISFLNDGVPYEIPKDVSLCLYRIVQEGLRNIIQHSCAGGAEIILRGADSSIVLKIRDAGIGFDPTEARKQQGLGLASMRERAGLVGGDFSVKSQPGHGTVISVIVPLTGGGA